MQLRTNTNEINIKFKFKNIFNQWFITKTICINFYYQNRHISHYLMEMEDNLIILNLMLHNGKINPLKKKSPWEHVILKLKSKEELH